MKSRGSIPALLSFIIAAGLISSAILTVVITNFFVVGNVVKSQQAFNIAEAGLNYYLWHMSHSPADFKDGQTTPATPDATLGYGPYVHNYIDDNGKTTGTYTLWVKPQGSGSTIFTVRSIGKTNDGKLRTVQAQVGAASFASYGVVSDLAMWFGATETADGPVHSNQGVRMDGQNTGPVTSANATYVPSAQIGGNGSTSHPGVWCDTTVTTPVNCNTRNKADWQYPVSSVDFNQVAGSLCTMKKKAFGDDSSTAALASQSTACSQTPTTRTPAYLPQRSTTVSSSRGYLVSLNAGGTYDVSYVNSEDDTKSPYTSALGLQSVATGVAIPPSGIIFTEDNVWVRTNGNFHGRVTIASGRLSTNDTTDITIAAPVSYSVKDGSDAIGLVAEDGVSIAPYAAPATGNFALEVDAAILAQGASVDYPQVFRADTNNCSRGWVGSGQTLNFYGSVASRQTWTWSWQRSSACGSSVRDPVSGYYISGFLNNTTTYDQNLKYAPPPSYPITGGYDILSWREVLTKP